MTWVSVDDRLPEVGRYVIGATPIDDEVWHIRLGRFRRPEDRDGIAVIAVDGSMGWHWISHWMPLPEPPSE